MMATLLRLETPTVMNIDTDCGVTRHNTSNEDDIVVMDGRTTIRKLCAFRKCHRFEHGDSHISLCWTVFLIVIVVILGCPGSSVGLPVPGRLEADHKGAGRQDGGRQKRAIIGDNVVSTHFSVLCCYIAKFNMVTLNTLLDNQGSGLYEARKYIDAGPQTESNMCQVAWYFSDSELILEQ
jgi:hypothetical protein